MVPSILLGCQLIKAANKNIGFYFKTYKKQGVFVNNKTTLIMKKLLLLGLVLLAKSLPAQYSFAVSSFNEIDLETKETKSTVAVNQIFNISLKDGYLIHNVLNESGSVDDSQVYKIISKKDKNGVLVLSCKSGISGNVYEYLISKDAEGGATLYQVANNALYLLESKMTPLKTYKN
jgi:hypothetical protein